jgi:virginiamycin B lyase
LGTVTNYGGDTESPEGITSGPDGALWYTNSVFNSIGRITTAGVVTNYTGSGIDEPDAITSSPDGDLWFTSLYHDSIGRISTGE